MTHMFASPEIHFTTRNHVLIKFRTEEQTFVEIELIYIPRTVHNYECLQAALVFRKKSETLFTPKVYLQSVKLLCNNTYCIIYLAIIYIFLTMCIV